MKTITLKVSGMACSHCETIVRNSVAALPGVARAAASATTDSVTVEYDEDKVTPEEMKTAITQAGYDIDN